MNDAAYWKAEAARLTHQNALLSEICEAAMDTAEKFNREMEIIDSEGGPLVDRVRNLVRLYIEATDRVGALEAEVAQLRARP